MASKPSESRSKVIEMHGRNANGRSLTCIPSSIIGIVNKYLAEREHARRLGKIRPKVLANVLDRVNTQPIHFIILHQLVDPIKQLPNHDGILRVEISQWHLGISEPALLHGGLVACIRRLGNKATLVEGGSVVEWVGEAGDIEVGGWRGHVVHNNVEHEEHVAVV